MPRDRCIFSYDWFEEDSAFRCESCKKSVSSLRSLKRHHTTCKQYIAENGPPPESEYVVVLFDFAIICYDKLFLSGKRSWPRFVTSCSDAARLSVYLVLYSLWCGENCVVLML